MSGVPFVLYQILLLRMRKYLLLRRAASPDKGRWQWLQISAPFAPVLDLCRRSLKLYVPIKWPVFGCGSAFGQTASTWGFQTVSYLGGAMPPLETSEIFFDETLLKMGFQTYIFCSSVPSKCRKCRFKDPKFENFVVTMASPSIKSWLRYCFHTTTSSFFVCEQRQHSLYLAGKLVLYQAYILNFSYAMISCTKFLHLCRWVLVN